MTATYIWKRIVIMVAITLIMVACIIWLFKPRNDFTRDPTVIAKIASKIARQHNLVIGYGSPSTFYIPPHPVKPCTWVIERADIHELDPALKALESVLEMYPEGFFAHNCKGVFFCDSLLNGSERAAGTYGPCWLIIAVDRNFSEQDRFDEVRQTIHHEFSSLIWHSMPFTQLGWILTQPRNWKAEMNTIEMLKAGARRTVEPSSGFLSDYGATNSENDFNVYAETIFTDPERILKLAAQYPIIAQKTAMFMNAYISVEPRMEQVFAKLKLLHLRSSLDGSGNIVIKATSPVEMPQGEAISLPNQ